MKTPQPAFLARSARILLASLAGPVALCPSAFATDGVWTNVNASSWSISTNWADNNIADGAGSIADFSQTNIAAARNVTIDGAVASRTIGTLLFGDIDSTHGYTINSSGSGTLTFNNNGTAAAITQGVNSGANIISAPVLLADSLNTNNNSASLLTVSGTVSASTAGTKTITNQGSGTGGVTLSGVISNGSGSVAIVQNSATSTLTLSGTNTFDTGVQIKQGTVLANNAAALGTGTVLLGDTSGTANATLSIGSFTIANNITVQAGSTGTLTIMGNGGSAARPTGNILLDNDLTLEVTTNGAGRNSGAFLHTTGTISGTQDLNLNVSGGLSTSNNAGSPQMDSLSVGGAVTTTGAINNVGTGEGRAIISGNITNAASVNQNSATSMLSLSGTNTYTGSTNVNAGILRINNSASLSGASTTTVASGGTLQLGTSVTVSASQPLTLSGHGTAYSSGALETTNTATYAGAIVLGADTTVGSTLANNTLTLSGSITGTGRTLTTTGVSSVAISGSIGTGTGGLTKEGAGTTTLSAANTYTGVTQINNGVLALSNANALGGGGDISFGGGTLRHSATNSVDYASRIVNSTGPIAIDTNAVSNITYAGNIASSNTGGLTKLGTGRLTLSGTNAFTGSIAVNAGALAITTTSAIPSLGTGQIFIDSNGALNTGGAYTTVQNWLDSDNINTASSGVIALVGNNAEAIDFTGYDNLGLGATATSTYTGTLTAASTGYRLGGGGATLTLSGTNALTGANALSVNGNVTLSAANNLTGDTTVSAGTFTLGTGGTLLGSAITVGSGGTLALATATSGSPVTRTPSVTLTGGSLTIAGNATANSTDTITSALTVGAGGNSTITLTPNAARNTLLTAGSFVREAGSTALIRGTNLGSNALGTINSANITFTTPNLVGNGGTGTDRSIFVGVVGDTSATGSGFGATGGLLTQDAANGVRLLASGEYKTSITDGQTTLDNILLTSASGTVATTVNSDTTLNSLSFGLSGSGASNVAISGTGKLTLNSGVIYSNASNTRPTSGGGGGLNTNTISNNIGFNDREAVILVGGGNGYLTLSGILSDTDGKGLTVYAPSRSVTFSGSSANTYTGTTTVNGGTLTLSKTSGVTAINGNVVINSGATLTQSTANQIADTANITVNGGTLNLDTETFNDLTLNGGSATNATATAVTVTGVTTLSNGGTLTLARSQNINGVYDSVTTLGALNIINRSSGAYTAITVGHGSGLGQSGAKLILGGDVTFTGNSTNTNTVLIDAIKGSGRQGVIELTATAGNRTFTIGNGAAASDLEITAALLDGTGASGLVKAGLGTLALSGANTYSGNTAVNAGGLVLDQSGSLTFYIGANGVTNSVTGSGAATFNGSFNFDLTNASASDGNSWLIVDTGTLSESFTASFGVNGFTQNADVWTNGSGYSFSEATGILSYSAVPEPSTFALLGGAASLLLATFRRRRTTR